MEELRIRIWDYLYRIDSGQPIEAIAQELNVAEEAISQAVKDPWFYERDGNVAIAESGS